MTTRFATKDSVSEATKLEEVLLQMSIGDVITYDEMDRILDRPFLGSRTPIYAAIKRVQSKNKRTFANVPGVGYRMVEPKEHYTLGRRHAAKAVRSSNRGIGVTTAADRNLLTTEQINQLDALQEVQRGQAEFNRRSTRRLNKLERVIEQTREEAKANRDESQAGIATVQAQVDQLNEDLQKMKDAVTT